MPTPARQIEKALWALGLTCVCYLLFIAAQAQVSHRRAVDLSSGSAEEQRPLSGSVVGRLEIPALRISAAVLEDDQSTSLMRGLGHIRGTAELGGLGNAGLAGHRDTFLRPLRGVTPGMQIRAANRTGVYRYVVDSTEIVKPEAVEVLDIGSRPELTLITCYPFNYVGAAPRRFVVHAHLVSVLPDTPEASGAATANPPSSPSGVLTR